MERSTAFAPAAKPARPAPASPRRAAMGRNASTNAKVGLAGLGRKTRDRLRKSPSAKRVFSSILPDRNPAPSGVKGTKPMPSSCSVGSSSQFGFTPEQRIFALDGRDRLDRMGAANGPGTGLGQAEMADLALGDQVADGAGNVLDRHGRIDAVLIEQVDPVGAQALQRGFGHGLDMGGRLLVPPRRPPVSGSMSKPELGRDHHPVADGMKGLAQQFLVEEGAVSLGCVEQRHATVMRRATGRSFHPGRGPRHKRRSCHAAKTRAETSRFPSFLNSSLSPLDLRDRA